MPGTTTPQRARTSRKPSGLASPPLILLAGPDLTGRSTQAAEGTASDLVGMSYWIQIGGNNNTADYYGGVKGARYEIVEHTGSHDDICDAIRWASAQPPVDGKRNMLVLDDVSALWDLHSDEVALVSQARAERRAQSSGRRHARLDDPYVDEDRDLWVKAKERWGEVLWLLRQHPGPVVIVARQEIVTTYEADHPTRHTFRRLRAEKNLTGAVDAIVEFHAVGEAYVTGLHTREYELEPGRLYPFAGVDHLLRMLGYATSAPTRQGVESQPGAYLQTPQPEPRRTERTEQRAPQRQAQAQGQAQGPSLTGAAADQLVKQALRSQNPEAALLALRKNWGIDILRTVTVPSWWGEISVDELITRSLDQARKEAARRQREAAGNQRQEPAAGAAQPSREEPRGHHAHDDEPPAEDFPPPPPEDEVPAPSAVEPPPPAPEHEEPPAEDDAPPPPPDPAREEPPAERPEDVSEAEEPQHVPPPRPAASPRRKREDRGMAIARAGLTAEADIQARLRFVTLGEHLGPITEDGGDPPVTILRDHVVKHRPALVRQLREEGHEELAEAYRNASVPDMGLPKLFASYFADKAPAGK